MNGEHVVSMQRPEEQQGNRLICSCPTVTSGADANHIALWVECISIDLDFSAQQSRNESTLIGYCSKVCNCKTAYEMTESRVDTADLLCPLASLPLTLCERGHLWLFFSDANSLLKVTCGACVCMQIRKRQLRKLKSLWPFEGSRAAGAESCLLLGLEGNVINSKSCESAFSGEAASALELKSI